MVGSAPGSVRVTDGAEGLNGSHHEAFANALRRTIDVLGVRDLDGGRLVSEPVEYGLARLQEALTHDPRVLEQSLEVRVEGDRVILREELATPERCQAAIAVASEVFPEATVVADLVSSAERRRRSDPERL